MSIRRSPNVGVTFCEEGNASIADVSLGKVSGVSQCFITDFSCVKSIEIYELLSTLQIGFHHPLFIFKLCNGR